jgi:hypothetical protein
MKNILQQPDQSMHPNNKCSFILRMWREVQSDTLNWRASVENSETGKRIGFASLEQLFAFLIDWSESNGEMYEIEEKEKKECNGRTDEKSS